MTRLRLSFGLSIWLLSFVLLFVAAACSAPVAPASPESATARPFVTAAMSPTPEATVNVSSILTVTSPKPPAGAAPQTPSSIVTVSPTPEATVNVSSILTVTAPKPPADVASQTPSPTVNVSPTPEATVNVNASLTVTSPKPPAGAASQTPSPTVNAPVHTLVAAHRGGAAYAPENTLAAFSRAIQIGADMVECDVHLSKDGQVVVMHDPNVSTTTDGRGLIGDLTLAELKKLNAAAKFPGGYAAQTIPTLAELLDLVKGKIGIQIEIKNTASGGRYAGIEKQVLDLITARGMADQVIIISFDFAILKDVKAVNPHIRTGALVREGWFASRSPDQAVADAVGQTGAEYFMPTAGPVTLAVVQAAHAREIKVGVWTVDAAADMKRYAGFGVDAITTNRPDDLMKVLGR